MHFAAGCLLGLFALASDGQIVESGSVFDLLEEARQVVVSVTKTGSTVADTPAIVAVITKDDIQTWGYRTLAEVLKHALGFYVVDDHMLPNLAVRGMSGGLFAESGIVKLMIDSKPVTFRTTAGNWLGPEFLPMAAIERVEIVRGPASSLYGADAFLGAINVVTTAATDAAAARARLGAVRNHFMNDVELMVSGASGAFDWMLAGRLAMEDRSGITLPGSSPAARLPGFRSATDPASDLTLGSDVLYGRARYHFSERSSVGAFGYVSAIERGAELSPWSQLTNGLDPQGRASVNRVALAHGLAGLDAEIGVSQTFVLRANAQFFAGGPTARDRLDFGQESYLLRRFGFMGIDSVLEAQWQPLPSLSVVAGAGLYYDRERLPENDFVLKYDVAGHAQGESVAFGQAAYKDLFNPGAYLQSTWQILPKQLSATAGARFDWHNIYGAQVSPRVGLNGTIADNLHVKLLYGGAFKAPSPFLLYAVPYNVGGVIGNPDLKAQYVHTIEGEVSVELSKVLVASTSLSYNYLLNAAQFVAAGSNLSARNVARIGSLSWETGIEAHYQDRIAGYVRFGYNTVRRETGRDSLYVTSLLGTGNPIYPALLGHAGLTGKLPVIGVRLGAEVSLVGPRTASDDNVLARGSTYQLPAYAMLGASITAPAFAILGTRKSLISVVGQNLLEPRVADPGFAGIDYPLVPRTIYFELRQEL